MTPHPQHGATSSQSETDQFACDDDRPTWPAPPPDMSLDSESTATEEP